MPLSISTGNLFSGTSFVYIIGSVNPRPNLPSSGRVGSYTLIFNRYLNLIYIACLNIHQRFPLGSPAYFIFVSLPYNKKTPKAILQILCVHPHCKSYVEYTPLGCYETEVCEREKRRNDRLFCSYQMITFKRYDHTLLCKIKINK